MPPQPEIEQALAELVQQLREAAGANLLWVHNSPYAREIARITVRREPLLTPLADTL